jgi:hypothetical protein
MIRTLKRPGTILTGILSQTIKAEIEAASVLPQIGKFLSTY